MPITLSNLKSDLRTIEVEWEGETMNLTYRPSEYTPEMESVFVENMREDLPGNAFAKVLSRLIVSWEMLDEDGEEMTHDFETLSQFYTAFLTHLFNMITEDQKVAREDRKNLRNGSSRVVKKAPARRGTR